MASIATTTPILANSDVETFAVRAVGRNNNFDIIRFLLASLVILSHSYPLLQGDDSQEFLHRLTCDQMTAGAVAVNGFFILSGFLITQSFERTRTLTGFFKKRILRIYPAFLMAVALCTLVVAPLLASDDSEYWRSFSIVKTVLNALNLDLVTPPLHIALPYDAINGSLWSIRYEFFCYIAVALMGVAGLLSRKWMAVVALFAVLLVYAGQIYFDWKMPGSRLSTLWCYPGLWPRMASYYLAGVVFYLYRDRIPCSPIFFGVSIAALVAFSVFGSVKALPLAFVFFGTYAFFYIAFFPVPMLRDFAKRGDYSYGLYLYAFPVQQLLVQHWGTALTPMTLFLAAFPITLLLAFLSWTFVESPFLKKSPPKPAPESPSQHWTPRPSRTGRLGKVVDRLAAKRRD